MAEPVAPPKPVEAPDAKVKTVNFAHRSMVCQVPRPLEDLQIPTSMSLTETAIVPPPSARLESLTKAEDCDNGQGTLSKPLLLRKKSGELVKPALRPSNWRQHSSMPGTLRCSKSVHSSESDNQTRHFLQIDKPMAVNAVSSPVETHETETEYRFDGSRQVECEIRLVNFPQNTIERKVMPVRVERIFLSADKQTLIGSIAVQNIAFHKLVVARFTLDNWKTTSEVATEYNHDPHSPPYDRCDRFIFHIDLSDLANIDTKTLFLCARYSVNGTDYWDNNKGTNYQVDFAHVARKPVKPSVTIPTLDRRPWNAFQ